MIEIFVGVVSLCITAFGVGFIISSMIAKKKLLESEEQIGSLEREISRMAEDRPQRLLRFPDDATLDDLVGEIQNRSLVGVMSICYADDGDTSATSSYGWGNRAAQLGMATIMKRDIQRRIKSVSTQ